MSATNSASAPPGSVPSAMSSMSRATTPASGSVARMIPSQPTANTRAESPLSLWVQNTSASDWLHARPDASVTGAPTAPDTVRVMPGRSSAGAVGPTTGAGAGMVTSSIDGAELPGTSAWTSSTTDREGPLIRPTAVRLTGSWLPRRVTRTSSASSDFTVQPVSADGLIAMRMRTVAPLPGTRSTYPTTRPDECWRTVTCTRRAPTGTPEAVTDMAAVFARHVG